MPLAPTPPSAQAPPPLQPCFVPAPVPAPALLSAQTVRCREQDPSLRPHLAPDRRRSRSVSDLLTHHQAFVQDHGHDHGHGYSRNHNHNHNHNHTLDGLGLSFQHAPGPAPQPGPDELARDPPAPLHVHIAARSALSAAAQLAACERPVTHLLLPSIHDPAALTELLECYLPTLAPSLLVLKVNNCQLTSLPAGIELCTELEELDISGNPLQGPLPSGIAHLTNLRVLLADHVGLTSLPTWLCNLKRLTVLSARHNRLAHLPSSLHKLACLERLMLDHNPWSPTWASLLAPIVRGPPSEPCPSMESQSSVTLASPFDDDEEDLASSTANTPTKTPNGLLSALRTSSVGDVKAGIKASHSSLTLHGTGSVRTSAPHSSGPTTPTSSASRSTTSGRHSFPSPDAHSPRSKWSFSLRRSKGLKLESPPLPFSFVRSLSVTSKSHRPSESEPLPSPSTSTTGPPSSTTGPLTPLDFRRFSGFNFWESLSSGVQSPVPDRANLGSPSAFRPGLAEHPSLAAPLSYLSLGSPSIDMGRRRSSPSATAEWTHRQAVEHRIDIKHLLASLHDMYDLEEANAAYQANVTTPFATPAQPTLSAQMGTESDPETRRSSVGEIKRVDDAQLRRRILREIIESEESYVRGMQEFMDVYVYAAQQFDPATSAPVIPLVEQRIIFGNFPALLHLHTNSFLPALKAAAHEGPGSDMSEVDRVAEVFLAHSAFFRMYKAYINNRDLAQSLAALWEGVQIPPGVETALAAQLHAAPGPCMLPVVSHGASPSYGSDCSLDEPVPWAAGTKGMAAVSKSTVPLGKAGAPRPPRPTCVLSKSARKARQKYLRKCATDPRRSHMSIESYLMLPVQRVPRYRLLLEALVKATPPASPKAVAPTIEPAEAAGAEAPLPSPQTQHQSWPVHEPGGVSPCRSTQDTTQDLSQREDVEEERMQAIPALWRGASPTLPRANASPCGFTTGTGSPASSISEKMGPCSSEDPVPARWTTRLDEALVQIRELAQEINESKRRAEQDHRLLEWQARIAGSFPSPLVQPHRRLVRDGVVTLRKIVRLSSEWAGAGSESDQKVPTLQQTVVEEPVVLLLCNDLVVFLTAYPESIPLLRAAGQDAAAHAAITEAVAASSCMSPSTSVDLRWEDDHLRPVPRPPPPDSAGPLLRADPTLLLEVFAVLRRWPFACLSSSPDSPLSLGSSGTKVERVDATSLRIMDHTKLLHLSAQSPGDAQAWIDVLQADS